MESLIASAIVGLSTITLGAYMIVSGNARLLHSYHYTNVPPEQMPALAREVGACIIALGGGIVLMMLGGDVLPVLAIIPGVALLVGGTVGMLASIIRRNGSLMAFSVGATRANRAAAVAIAVVTLLIATIPIGFGIHMMATGDVSSLHSYHREGISAADLPTFALVQGLCMVALGLGIPFCAVGGLGVTQRPAPLWARLFSVIGIVLFAGGLAGMLLTIPAFGGSLAP